MTIALRCFTQTYEREEEKCSKRNANTKEKEYERAKKKHGSV